METWQDITEVVSGMLKGIQQIGLRIKNRGKRMYRYMANASPRCKRTRMTHEDPP